MIPSMPRLALILIALVLSACAENTKYACPGMPDKPMCLPPSEVYAITDGQGPSPAAARRPSTLTTRWQVPCCGGTTNQPGSLQP